MPRRPPADKKANPIVVLHESQTTIPMNTHTEEIAIEAAYRLTLSPHEWEWTDGEIREMAHYCLWAHQRLAAIRGLSSEFHLPRANQ